MIIDNQRAVKPLLATSRHACDNRLSVIVSIITLTKTEQVRHAILLQILSGVLRPGQRLLEARLSKEFGVSQATVNAALQDLHNQGLVTKVLNRSTNVSRYTQAELENLFAVRLVLEPAAAEAVASRWSAEARTRLREQVDQMRRAARTKDLARFSLADYMFHQELYNLTANSFLIQAGQAIAAAPFAYILCGHPEALPTDYLALAEDHQEIILALEEGPEQAASLTRSRIQGWRLHSLRALAQVAELASPATL
jgi:DNA-binding GntR family transcriptional regulator